MSTRSKLWVAMLTVLAIAWTAQAKDPKTPKAPDSKAAQVESKADPAEAAEVVSDAPAKKSAEDGSKAGESNTGAVASEAEEVVTTSTEIPLPEKAPAASGVFGARTPRAGGWRFPVGIAFVSGESEVGDYYEEELGMDGNMLPIGLSFAPYYEFAHGSRLGIDLGPVSFIRVESNIESWDIPVGLTYGYKFMPEASVSPYLRGGVKYHIFTGDRIEDSVPGIFGAAGIEFFRTEKFFLSLEVGYDGSEVTLGDTTVQPAQVLVGLQIVFHDLFGKPAPRAPQGLRTSPENNKAAVRP